MPHWTRRARTRLIFLATGGLLLVALLLGATIRSVTGTPPTLTGTALGYEAAPDFRLRDSSDRAYRLSQFRGKVVVLAFMYTQCSDACPLTAELLRKADAAAGHLPNVEYVVVSVDPFQDNAATISAFSQEHHLEELGNRFHYLIGSLQELSPVWRSYYIRDADAPAVDQTIDDVSSLYFIDKRWRSSPSASSEDRGCGQSWLQERRVRWDRRR